MIQIVQGGSIAIIELGPGTKPASLAPPRNATNRGPSRKITRVGKGARRAEMQDMEKPLKLGKALSKAGGVRLADNQG